MKSPQNPSRMGRLSWLPLCVVSVALAIAAAPNLQAQGKTSTKEKDKASSSSKTTARKTNPPQKETTVMVTGSRIPRKVTSSGKVACADQNVTVIDRQQIDHDGGNLTYTLRKQTTGR
jgi:hypothetical protein